MADHGYTTKEMYELYQEGKTLLEVGQIVGISSEAVRRRFMAAQLDRRVHTGDRMKSSKLSSPQVARLRRYFKAHPEVSLCDQDIADSYEVVPLTIYEAVTGRNWKHVDEPPVKAKERKNDR